MQFAQIGDTVYAYYAAAYADVKMWSQHLSVVCSGVPAGQLFHDVLRPDPALALFHDVARDHAPEADLTLDEAREYLRKHDLDPALFAEGMNLVTFGGLPVGWAKRIGRRVNNLYPLASRIANL